MTRPEAESTTSAWACLTWMVSVTVTETFPVTRGLGNVIANFFWRQTQTMIWEPKVGVDADITSSAPQIRDFDLGGVELALHDGAAGVGGTRMWGDRGRRCTIASSFADPGLFSELRLALSMEDS